MVKNIFGNARDIGEGMAVINGEGKSFTIVNTETGKSRRIVSEDGWLLVDDDEINFEAMEKGCSGYYDGKSVEYWFGCYGNFRNGVCALCWTISPDGLYFADEDGFGAEDNGEEMAYCVINRNMEIIVPFQPMNDVRGVLKKYEK